MDDVLGAANANGLAPVADGLLKGKGLASG